MHPPQYLADQRRSVGSEGPWVDVVIPVRDRERTIARAVESVLRQTWPRFHLYVVDDGSTDATADIVSGVRDARITVIRQRHQGVSAARNTGARAGGSEYLAFLDSDDEAHTNWLAELLALRDGAAAMSCACLVTRPGKDDVVRRPPRLGPEFFHSTALFMAGSFMVRRSIFETIGGFATELRHSENTELGLRISAAAHREGLLIRPTEAALLTVNQRSGGGSEASSPEALLSASRYLVQHHSDVLRLNPSHLAACHAVAGVNALRLGEKRTARHELGAAVRLSPRSGRYWARLVQAWLPTPPARSST